MMDVITLVHLRFSGMFYLVLVALHCLDLQFTTTDNDLDTILRILHLFKHPSIRPSLNHTRLLASPTQPYRPLVVTGVQNNILLWIDDPLYSRERFIDSLVEELRLLLAPGLEDVAKLLADMFLVSVFDEVGVAPHVPAS